MNFFKYFGESFLCGLVTAIIQLSVLNDQKRRLRQSPLSHCKQESFIFKRFSVAQTELLFVKQKGFQEKIKINKK